MKKKVVVDFDDVLVPTLENAIILFNKENTQVSIEDFTCWDTSKVASNFCEYFYKIDFTKIQEKNNSIHYMRELCERYEVYIVTASHVDKFKKKQEWVAKNMPFFNIKNMVLCHDKSIIKAFAMVDDRAFNLKYCDVECKFLYSTLHNKCDTGLERVSDLGDFINKLDKYLDMK